MPAESNLLSRDYETKILAQSVGPPQVLNLPRDIAKIFDDSDCGGKVEAYNDFVKLETIGTAKNFSLPRLFAEGKTSMMR